MIDIIIIIIFVIIFILFKMIKNFDEVKLIIDYILVSTLCFYIGYNISNIFTSKLFLILGIISFLLIPISIILKYIEKITIEDKK
jgi:hypothetical protein